MDIAFWIKYYVRKQMQKEKLTKNQLVTSCETEKLRYNG